MFGSKASMLSKFGYLLLFICIVCVFLFVIFGEKDLRSHQTDFIHPQTTYETTRQLLENVRYVIEPPCNATFIVWLVTSYAGDPSARSALRRAYTDEELQTLGIKRIFLLGMLNDNATRKTHITQNALVDESQRFNDILQGNFVDTYRNLTRKHLMGLRWAVNNCKRIKYLIKMDDDIVINMYDILDRLHSIVDKDSLTGYVLKNMIPVREPASKWYVSKMEYTDNIYPDFVSGWFYIMHPRVANRLINYAVSSNKYLWIDDVFITGILRQILNIKLRNIDKLYTTDHRYLECCLKGRERLLKCEYLIGPNGGNVELQVKFKEFVKFCNTICSVRSENNLVGKTCVIAYKEPNLLKGSVQINSANIL